MNHSQEILAEVQAPATLRSCLSHLKLTKENAVAVMNELKPIFPALASYQSKNLFISFQRRVITASARLQIITGIYLGPSKTMHVDVYASWPMGWTFSTEEDHVFYLGQIKFST